VPTIVVAEAVAQGDHIIAAVVIITVVVAIEITIADLLEVQEGLITTVDQVAADLNVVRMIIIADLIIVIMIHVIEASTVAVAIEIIMIVQISDQEMTTDLKIVELLREATVVIDPKIG